jgi:pimeloyl-ACP methyl ester carboxylesterase
MNEEVEKWRFDGNFFDYGKHRVFYLQKGEGENLLIIQGYPYSSFEWKETIGDLSKTYRVTTLDLLGMGFSDKPKDHRYSFEEYCEILNALLKKLHIDRTHIVAHDLGVSIAQELLVRQRTGENSFKIQSLAFMNGSLFIDVYRPRLIQRLLSQSPGLVGKVLSRLLSKERVNKSVRSLFGPNTQPTDAFLDKQWEILNYKDGKAISYLIGRLVFEKFKYLERWVKEMQNTKVPMCYICGPFDPNSGMHMAERYKELIPDPLIYVLEKNIGYCLYYLQRNCCKYIWKHLKLILRGIELRLMLKSLISLQFMIF